MPELDQPGASDGSVNVSSEVILDSWTIDLGDDRFLLIGDVTP